MENENIFEDWTDKMPRKIDGVKFWMKETSKDGRDYNNRMLFVGSLDNDTVTLNEWGDNESSVIEVIVDSNRYLDNYNIEIKPNKILNEEKLKYLDTDILYTIRNSFVNILLELENIFQLRCEKYKRWYTEDDGSSYIRKPNLFFNGGIMDWDKEFVENEDIIWFPEYKKCNEDILKETYYLCVFPKFVGKGSASIDAVYIGDTNLSIRPAGIVNSSVNHCYPITVLAYIDKLIREQSKQI